MKNANNDNEEDTFQPIGLAAEKLINRLAKSSELSQSGLRRNSKDKGGLFLRSEGAEASGLSVEPDLCVPSTVLPTVDALETGRRATSAVPKILRLGGFPKVAKSVVIFAAINVVDNLSRPLASHIEPRQSMSEKPGPIDDDRAIPAGLNLPGRLLIAGVSFQPANENSRSRIVEELGDKATPSQERLFLSHSIFRFHAALILNKFKNLVQTNGLGDAGPVDEVSKDDEERGGRNPETRIDRESEHPRRASAR